MLLVAGCGGGDTKESREKAIEDAAARHGFDADVTVGDDGEPEKIVINQGGGQVGQNLDLPSGFPDDIKLPDDLSIMAASSPLPNGHSIQALSPRGVEETLANVRTKMSGEGWVEVATDSLTPQMSRINFEKDDRMANFNIIANGETSAVQLLTMPKP